MTSVNPEMVELAERYLLQGIVANPAIIPMVSNSVPEEAFGVPARFLYRAAKDAFAAGVMPDAAVIIHRAAAAQPGISLEPFSAQVLESAGDNVAMNWKEHAVVISNAYVAKVSVNEAGKIVRAAMSGGDPSGLSGMFLSAAQSVSQAAVGRSPVKTANDMASDYIDRMMKMDGGVNTISFSTGIAGLDDILNGGWHRGHLHTLFAMSGSGKSTIADFCLFNALVKNEPGFLLSYEMPAHEVNDRLVSILTGIPFQLSMLSHGDRRLRQQEIEAIEQSPFIEMGGRIPDSLMALGMNASAMIADFPLHIHDKAMGVNETREKIISHVAMHPTSLIILDHMLRMPVTDKRTKLDNLDEGFEMLADLAMATGTAILAVTQPNRTMSAEDVPVLSHLAYAGERPSQRIIGLQTVGNRTGRVRHMKLHVIKHRNGPEGVVDVMVDMPTFTVAPA